MRGSSLGAMSTAGAVERLRLRNWPVRGCVDANGLLLGLRSGPAIDSVVGPLRVSMRSNLIQRERRRRNGSNRPAYIFPADDCGTSRSRCACPRNAWPPMPRLASLGLLLFADVDDDSSRLPGSAIVDCRTPSAVAGHFVPRTIGRHLLAKPSWNGANALGAANVVIALLAVLQQVGQLQASSNRQTPAVPSKRRSAGHACRRLVGQKRRAPRRRGQHADGVEERPADKLGIAAQGPTVEDRRRRELVEHIARR